MDIDQNYKRNVFGISIAEALWGIGAPLVVESTFLQLFLKNLGASSFAIGLIPALFFIGCSVFALLGDYWTTHLTSKRTPIIIFHLFSSLSVMMFGIVLLFFGDNRFLLVAFFSLYAAFSISIGVMVPVWYNYIVKIFSPEKTVPALAIMMISQNSAKLICSFLIVKTIEKYSFSINSSAFIFILVGLVFALSGLCYLFTREINSSRNSGSSERESFFYHSFKSIRMIINNRNFLFFLAGDFDFFVIISIISFYANYATIYCGINPSIAGGVFVGCIYCGAITTNILFGIFKLLSLRNKYLISKLFSILGIILMMLFSSGWSFFLASFLFGISRDIRPLAFAPTVKRLSGLEDSTSYFAVALLLRMPFAFCLPLLYGAILDRFSYLNGNEYRIIFFISILIIFAALMCVLKTNFPVEPLQAGIDTDKPVFKNAEK
ncbi:MAG: MFS transporter [Desulfobacterales bacterium]|nr:MFS transporter [Desulfobacterales bacterium]